MIDSGVAGSELMIEKAVIESGCHPSDIKAIFLTHAHPDHIGTASYFREKDAMEMMRNFSNPMFLEMLKNTINFGDDAGE